MSNIQITPSQIKAAQEAMRTDEVLKSLRQQKEKVYAVARYSYIMFASGGEMVMQEPHKTQIALIEKQEKEYIKQAYSEESIRRNFPR